MKMHVTQHTFPYALELCAQFVVKFGLIFSYRFVCLFISYCSTYYIFILTNRKCIRVINKKNNLT